MPSVPTGSATSTNAGSVNTGHAAVAGTRTPADGETGTSTGTLPAAQVPEQTCAHPAPEWGDVSDSPQSAVEGYTDTDSALPGTKVGLYVSTLRPTWRVTAFRMGYYGATQGCQVWQSAWQHGKNQGTATILPTTSTAVANWEKSLTVDTAGWQPGAYLLRLDTDSTTIRRFMPLIVRSPSLAGRVVILATDTTWQAYNLWGGFSLYFGEPGHTLGRRSRAVTFDRPYNYGRGAAGFFDDLLPVVTLAEKLHLPVAYATDVDIDREPAAFATARAVISAGHDEYYSPVMRRALTTARDRGVNLAFLGSNAIYRKIRYARTKTGPLRLEINYKDATDPIKTPSLVTTQWRDAPSNDPESALTGQSWQCAATKFYPIVVADETSWLFAGTAATKGMSLPSIAGHEFDGIVTTRPIPRPMSIVFHSATRCHDAPATTDTTYYTTPSGAGVFDAGSYFWDCAIDNVCRIPITADTQRIITRVTANLLEAAAAGPIGRAHPVVDNVRQFYPAAPVPTRESGAPTS